MDNKVKKEILEFMDLVLSRGDVRKSMKDKKVEGNMNEIEDELKNIKSESVKEILTKISEENKKNRIKILCKKYGKILLKEGLYNKIMGVKSDVKKK